MSLQTFNLLLALVGLFAVVGAVALPALVQWPRPVSSRSFRAYFFGLEPAGGGWR